MTEILSFIGDHPFISFFLFYLLCELLYKIVCIPTKRFLRHLDIKKHGWPPAHCDADGDFRRVKDDTDEEDQ